MVLCNTHLVQNNFCTSCGDHVGVSRLKQCSGVAASREGKDTKDAVPCKARICFTNSKGERGCMRLSNESVPFRCQGCSRKMGVGMVIVSNSPHLSLVTTNNLILQEQSYTYNPHVLQRHLMPFAVLLLTFAPLKNYKEMTTIRRFLSSQLKIHYGDIPEMVSWPEMCPCTNAWCLIFFGDFLHRVWVPWGSSSKRKISEVWPVCAGSLVQGIFRVCISRHRFPFRWAHWVSPMEYRQQHKWLLPSCFGKILIPFIFFWLLILKNQFADFESMGCQTLQNAPGAWPWGEN